MKKILIPLLIIIILGLGVFYILPYFQKVNETQGFLKLQAYPAEATVKINNKTYQSEQGSFNISLSPGTYKLLLSCPEYSFIEKSITIEGGKTLDLGNLFLFPSNWQKENIVASENIERFYLTPDTNRIIYIEKESDYKWYLFNRNSQEKELFWKTSSFPQEVVLSSKKIVVNLGKNNWQIVFLPKSLIQNSISLTNTFKESLTNAGLKRGATSLEIIQVNFYPTTGGGSQNDGLVIRTNDAIFLFNFLTGAIEKIYEGVISPFILDENYIYFLKDNGVLNKISLETKQNQQISFYSFESKNLEQTKIRKSKIDDQFLIIEGTQKAFYVQSPESIPLLIGSNVLEGAFSPDEKEILLNLKDKIEIYDIQEDVKFTEKLYADIPAIWFLDKNHFLFLKDRALNIFLLKENKIWPMANNIKNNNFFYDSTINYVFYLSDEGIARISI
ncbi:MAG: hypothetical protein PHF45_01335 [Candidatus Pacebacteria bacterium]|nr:hypothetical protein [Candidatus Paceibacterota bacterium]